MRPLTTRARLTCSHPPGRAHAGKHAQGFVRVEGAHVLVEDDPSGLGVSLCSLVPPNTKPCDTTLDPVAGHSSWVHIEGQRVCLESITGPTDGVPPGAYAVVEPGQDLLHVVEAGGGS